MVPFMDLPTTEWKTHWHCIDCNITINADHSSCQQYILPFPTHLPHIHTDLFALLRHPEIQLSAV